MTNHFQNLAIELETLPKIEELKFIPIDRNYLKVSRISSFIFLFVIGVAGFLILYFNEEANSLTYLIVGGAYLVFSISSQIMITLGFKKKKYALREKDIVYSKGLIWSVRTAIPFNRIQHAEIKQGPIDRKFNLSSLKVFTAGGQSSDLVIPGLPGEKAQQLKDFVLGKTAEDGG